MDAILRLQLLSQTTYHYSRISKFTLFSPHHSTHLSPIRQPTHQNPQPNTHFAAQMCAVYTSHPGTEMRTSFTARKRVKTASNTVFSLPFRGINKYSQKKLIKTSLIGFYSRKISHGRHTTSTALKPNNLPLQPYLKIYTIFTPPLNTFITYKTSNPPKSSPKHSFGCPSVCRLHTTPSYRNAH